MATKMIRGILTKGDDGVWTKGAVRFDTIPADAVAPLAVHGAYQVCTDATAGKPDSERAGIFADTLQRIISEGWPFARAEAGPGLAIEAIARVKKCDVARAKAAYEKMDADAQKALANAPAIKVAIAEIRLERAEAAAIEAADTASDVLGTLEV